MTRRTTSHAHLHDGLQYQGLQAQIFPPAALKTRMMLVMWQVNSNNPACGHCPLNPEGSFSTCQTWPLSSYILLSSSGGKKISHGDFHLTLIREMLEWSGHEPPPSMPVGRPAPASTIIRRLDTRHNKHWPGRNTKQQCCRVCSARGVTRTVVFKCVKCDMALCVDRSCFEDYHTKNDL